VPAFVLPSRFGLGSLGGAVARGLPQGRGNRGGVGPAGVALRGRLRPAQQFIEPFGVNLGAKKIGLGQDAAKQRQIGLDAGGGIFVEGAAKASDALFAAVAPGDEFAVQPS